MWMMHLSWSVFCFFFNDTATTEIYTLSLHDALPISNRGTFSQELWISAQFHQARSCRLKYSLAFVEDRRQDAAANQDRKSTRLNSSHITISYAVFCLKKKTKSIITQSRHGDSDLVQ